MAYLPLVWWFGGRIGFAWSRAVKVQALSVEAAARQSDLGGAAAGLVLGGALGLWSLVQLASRTTAGGKLGRIATVGEREKDG
ncbi:hypothetical protein FHS78_001925 [Parvibaculum indicum]|uniref:hypothetical protein n=1 Tax=Parvibaculum indicum TaxID=562969 RepID=UPI00141FFBC1|nr:hypothetical protein [Parvibaculum indicum]NIJ41635.1 hypothetical protein [Parvibaculum indicum]